VAGALGAERGLTMDIAAIQKKLEEKFGGAIGPVTQGHVAPWIEVDPEAIDAVAACLQGDHDTLFECLSNLSGVDYPARGHIQVVYHLVSYAHGHEVTLKVNTDREDPKVKTVTGAWAGANWLEREVYDLLGVDFVGHPDLRRILLPEDWVGNPLRKDYVEAPDYHGISTIRESMLRIELPERN
jgi:NADH-quinone oxidoreductase subunit C